MIHVNHRCQLTEVGACIVVFVDGAAWLSFDADDTACRRLAMVQLAERSVGTHQQIASAFGLKPLAVDRFRRAYREQGLAGLLPKRKGPKGPRVTGGSTDKVILAAKRAGQSNASIAGKLGISRPSVRNALLRLGYRAEPRQEPLAEPPNMQVSVEPSNAQPTDEQGSESGRVEASDPGTLAVEPQRAQDHAPQSMPSTAVPVAFTADMVPSNRSIDRSLAAQGLLHDAAPLFGDADGIREIGVLLAVPVLTQQGVFAEALHVFDGIGPAFYGLRTTVVCLCLLMVLNLCRPQDVMQREPGSVGKLLGLDRSPEVKTLRRKLHTLAAQQRSLQWMEALARRQLDEPGSETLWLYIDGHVSVYSGKHRLREHHVARLRAARPSVMDYWVNQPDGAPLLVVTGAPQEGLVRQVPQTIETVRRLAPDRLMTVVFDREGWSPLLFAKIKQMEGVHFLTYRKTIAGKRLARLPGRSFSTCTTEAAGRTVSYELADTRVRIPYWQGGRRNYVELRQITRRKADGKQTHVLTDDEQTSAVELGHRMFGRWSQENYFKYAREHRDLDAMVTQAMDPADGTRLVPNPERAQIKARLAKLGAERSEAYKKYGKLQLESGALLQTGKAAHIAYVQQIDADIARLEVQRNALPARVPWNDTDKGRDAKQPRAETRRLMHVFRILAHRAESALLELLRPHFPDWRHEGRSLVRAILHSSGALRVTDTYLHTTLEPLASPYKTRALAALCEELSRLETTFPGTNLKMLFDVRQGSWAS